MPWHEVSGQRFWIAEHESDGVILYHNKASIRPAGNDFVFLYVVDDECWRQYVKKDVRSRLIFGQRFALRHANWAKTYACWPEVVYSLQNPDFSRYERLKGWGGGALWSPHMEDEISAGAMEREDWADSQDDFDGQDWESYSSGPDGD